MTKPTTQPQLEPRVDWPRWRTISSELNCRKSPVSYIDAATKRVRSFTTPCESLEDRRGGCAKGYISVCLSFLASRFRDLEAVYYACDPEFGPRVPRPPKGVRDGDGVQLPWAHDVRTAKRYDQQRAEQKQKRDRYVRALSRAGKVQDRPHNYAAVHREDGSLHIFADVDGTARSDTGLTYDPLTPDEAVERLRDVLVVGQVLRKPSGSKSSKRNATPWTMPNPFRGDPKEDDDPSYGHYWPGDDVLAEAVESVSRRLSAVYGFDIDVTRPPGAPPYTSEELNTYIRDARRELGLD